MKRWRLLRVLMWVGLIAGTGCGLMAALQLAGYVHLFLHYTSG